MILSQIFSEIISSTQNESGTRRVRDPDQEAAKMTDNQNKTTGPSHAEVIQFRLLNNKAYYVPEHER